MDLKQYLESFSLLSEKDFSAEFQTHLYSLHDFHQNNCSYYRALIDNFYSENMFDHYEDLYSLPFLPVNLFKSYKLISCPDEEIFKVLHSSGTSGKTPSSIYLTRENARNQTIALSKIFTAFTKLKRPDILIIDSPDLISDRREFNARVAGIIGFRGLCRKSAYGLDSNYQVDLNSIEKFLENTTNQNILIFGFTWIIYKYFLQSKLPPSIREYLSKAVVLHGGGWKKLQSLSISRNQFNSIAKESLGTHSVLSYYGMIEQTGSIFMECEKGYLHSNPLASLICRSQLDLEPISIGNIGLAQVLSGLPTSYPGHSLLTDDLVEVIHQENCPCGRPGQAFLVHGRTKTAEVRGCSDTFRR